MTSPPHQQGPATHYPQQQFGAPQQFQGAPQFVAPHPLPQRRFTGLWITMLIVPVITVTVIATIIRAFFITAATFVSVGSFEIWLLWTHLGSLIIQSAGIGIAATVSAPSAGRRVGAILLGLVAPTIMLAVRIPQSLGLLSELSLFIEIRGVGYIGLESVTYASLATAYALARPVRGLGWIGYPVLVLLPGIVMPASFTDIDWRFVEAIDGAIFIALVLIGVALTESLTRVSERTAAPWGAMPPGAGSLGAGPMWVPGPMSDVGTPPGVAQPHGQPHYPHYSPQAHSPHSR